MISWWHQFWTKELLPEIFTCRRVPGQFEWAAIQRLTRGPLPWKITRLHLITCPGSFGRANKNASLG
ncbi:unnamed protein product [Allacma fusca]|uniref:Uncharacterized protein n=1 Tax=Allacma fusca TaxID=39272 RepID=A0A8J2L5I0_9HEXA|nr:unnamed protein product [Allacma fusca]